MNADGEINDTRMPLKSNKPVVGRPVGGIPLFGAHTSLLSEMQNRLRKTSNNETSGSNNSQVDEEPPACPRPSTSSEATTPNLAIPRPSAGANDNTESAVEWATTLKNRYRKPATRFPTRISIPAAAVDNELSYNADDNELERFFPKTEVHGLTESAKIESQSCTQDADAELASNASLPRDNTQVSIDESTEESNDDEEMIEVNGDKEHDEFQLENDDEKEEVRDDDDDDDEVKKDEEVNANIHKEKALEVEEQTMIDKGETIEQEENVKTITEGDDKDEHANVNEEQDQEKGETTEQQVEVKVEDPTMTKIELCEAQCTEK